MKLGVLSGLLLSAPIMVGAAFATAAPQRPAPPANAAEIEFFEKNVRPVLVQQCGGCHGAKLQQSGFRVDSRSAIMKGTDAGKIGLIPGNPDASLLMQVLRHTGPVKMPPAGKLPDATLAAIEQWIRNGAAWPEGAASAPAGADPARHWAFQPVATPKLPTVTLKNWPRNPLDRFVLARLEAAGLKPSPEASRATLIRRLSVDLTGLPPAAEEIEKFVADKAPNAYESLVDTMLSKPAYGERWGRYWLDLARFADTKGYVFTEDRNYAYAYTYRDWVVRALNEDLPYDQFVAQQIAADLLPSKEDRRSLAAMGFLTLGRRFLNSQPDIIDDRMDVTMRGIQGMTIGCSRCHDHKFDPITMRDYYGLYGVFASSTEPRDLPLIGDANSSAEYAAFEVKLGELKRERDSYLNARFSEVQTRARATIAPSMLAAHEVMNGAEVRAVAQRTDLPFALIGRWRNFLDETRKSHHPVFAPWHEFTRISAADFSTQSPALAARIAANRDPARLVNPLIAKAFEGPAPASLKEVAERLAAVLTNGTGDQQIRHALDSIGGPLNFTADQAEQFLNRAERDKLRALQAAVDKFVATSPAAPPRAMALADLPNPVQPRIFLRGNANNPGPEVPRAFLAVLSKEKGPELKSGSGRLELAQRLTDRSNPLTARVMVNRMWLGHFGSPLVRTPSDFGLRSDPPTHPELLEWLAASFMDGGWSMKKLHRTIVTSATYRQSSVASELAVAKDPDNRLLSRMPRRRMDMEAMRDSMLFASGRLDPTIGGKTVDIINADNARRSIYASIDRQNLPGFFRVFDFASPDTHSPQRFQTTVPQQSLYLLNSPFAVKQARSLAARTEVTQAAGDVARIRALYRLTYGRNPEPGEVKLAAQFLAAGNHEGAAARVVVSPWSYGSARLDAVSGRLVDFKPLKYVGDAWQAGDVYPDPKLGGLKITRIGGVASSDPKTLLVRRWTAPADGAVALTGALIHMGASGDGVRGKIIHAGGAVIGEYEANNIRIPINVDAIPVKKGDTIDFVVDGKASAENDAFMWNPTVRFFDNGKPSATAVASMEWTAATGFEGPPVTSTARLTPLERLAQALLVSNEFMFVD